MKNLFIFIALLLATTLSEAKDWKVVFTGHLTTVKQYEGKISTTTESSYDITNGNIYVNQPFTATYVIDDSVTQEPLLSTNVNRDLYKAIKEGEVSLDNLRYARGTAQGGYAQIWNQDPGYFKDMISTNINTTDIPFRMGTGVETAAFSIKMYSKDGLAINDTNIGKVLLGFQNDPNALAAFMMSKLTLTHYALGTNNDAVYMVATGTLYDVTVSPVYTAPSDATAPTPVIVDPIACDVTPTVVEKIVYVTVPAKPVFMCRGKRHSGEKGQWGECNVEGKKRLKRSITRYLEDDDDDDDDDNKKRQHRG